MTRAGFEFDYDMEAFKAFAESDEFETIEITIPHTGLWEINGLIKLFEVGDTVTIDTTQPITKQYAEEYAGSTSLYKPKHAKGD